MDLSDLLKNCEFKVFAGALAEGGSVRGINVKGAAATLTRKEIDKLTDFVKTYRAKGLAFTRLTAEAESSSYEKFLTEEEKTAIRTALGAETGDVLLLVADGKNKVVFDSLGALRGHWPASWTSSSPAPLTSCGLTDFPMYEWSEEENRFMAMHHPFTSPKLEDLDKMASRRPGPCLCPGLRHGAQRHRAGRWFHPDQRPGPFRARCSPPWASPRRRRRSGSAPA